jgi:ATP-dependent Clp protease adaptor protein ClpS
MAKSTPGVSLAWSAWDEGSARAGGFLIFSSVRRVLAPASSRRDEQGAPLVNLRATRKIGSGMCASRERRTDGGVVMATGPRESGVLEVEKQKVKPPPLYKVLLLNDDYTPMDFVIGVLQNFFGMTREQATQVMLKVHREGMGVCGVYPKDVAAYKVEQVLSYSRQHQHPLQCVMEES